LFSALRTPGARGGGVCYYLSNLYHGSVLKESIFIENNFESLAIKIIIPGVSQQIAVCLYRPPNANNTIFFNTLSLLLDKLRLYKIPIYIYTDINLDLMKINIDPNVANLMNIFTSFSYMNLITKCTRLDDSTGSKNILIISGQLNLPTIFLQTGICIDALAYHFITAVCIKLSKTKKAPKQETFSQNFSDTSVLNFREALAGISWLSVTEVDDTDKAADIFLELFSTLFELHFPLLRKKVNKKFIPVNSWMTQELLGFRQINFKLATACKINPTHDNKIAYVNYRKFYQSSVRFCQAAALY